jgi:hypothetical protein
MFERVKEFFGISAATQLPVIAPPKVRPGSFGLPSYFTTAKPTDSVLPQNDRRLASTDTTTLRAGSDTRKIIRDFVASSPELSAAVWAYIRLGLPQTYTAVAKNPDNTFNREATALVQQLITRFDLLPDYTVDGFTGPQSLRSTSESLAKEIIMYGALAGEVVLDKARLPKRIQPLSVTQIKFVANADKTLTPWQYVGSEKINLDVPTFIYCSLDQSLLDPYANSPIESAIKPVIYSESFANDITRIVSKVIHPRQKVTINEELVRKFLSPEAQMDATVARAELNTIISDIESKVNGLKPEDALVYLDSLGFEIENPSNAGLSSEYTVLQQMAQARLSTGSKTNGTVLGFASGSSNIASSEIMLFMRSCSGAIKAPVEEFWSRALTLSARLFAFDVVVEFRYDPIDLRPDNELLAFKQTKQMMVLEQLSLGLITDDEACLQLTGQLAPLGMTPLSGTQFKQGPGTATGGAAGGAGPTNDGSTLNQNLAPKTPDTARGQNKKKVKPAKPAKAAEVPNITMNIDNTKQDSAQVIRMRRDENGDLIVTKEQAA